MFSMKCVFAAIVMCCVFTWSATAGPESNVRKDDPGQSTTIPSLENDKKAEGLLKTALKAKQKHVFALLDQFKIKYGLPWQYDKGIREGYVKLENDRITREELSGLASNILNTMVALPYRCPLKDKELFQAVSRMCFHTNEQISNRFITWLYVFSEVPEDSIKELMSVLVSNPQGRPLLYIPLSAAMRKKYRTFWNAQIEREKREYEKYVKTKAGKATVSRRIIYLSNCAQMGNEVSSRKLIALYGQLKWDDKDYGRKARSAMRELLRIGTRDCIIAVLKRFRENVGSPKYRPGVSPRAEILRSLLWKYPDDAFFKPYRDYLAGPFRDTELDSAIGGTAGVKDLYSKLQAWVQKRYDYKLNLDGAEPKIKATPPVRKYRRK